MLCVWSAEGLSEWMGLPQGHGAVPRHLFAELTPPAVHLPARLNPPWGHVPLPITGLPPTWPSFPRPAVCGHPVLGPRGGGKGCGGSE